MDKPSEILGLVWRDGEFLSLDHPKAMNPANIHRADYATNVFDGIRAYKGSILMLGEHLERLFKSAAVYGMESPFSFDELKKVFFDFIKRYSDRANYFKPRIYKGEGPLGVNPIDSIVVTEILPLDWGEAYLGKGAHENGVWVLLSEDITRDPYDPTFFNVKCSGLYHKSQVAKRISAEKGLADALLMASPYVEKDPLGRPNLVADFSGANLVIIKKGLWMTPNKSSTPFHGLTLRFVTKLVYDHFGYQVHHHPITRDQVYEADEAMALGTAAEITPVVGIEEKNGERHEIGDGKPGKLTKEIQEVFKGYINTYLETREDPLSVMTSV